MQIHIRYQSFNLASTIHYHNISINQISFYTILPWPSFTSPSSFPTFQPFPSPLEISVSDPKFSLIHTNSLINIQSSRNFIQSRAIIPQTLIFSNSIIDADAPQFTAELLHLCCSTTVIYSLFELLNSIYSLFELLN
jgi:hypothetical protein